jgi:hypothetical protein
VALPVIKRAQDVKGVRLENDDAGSFGGAGALGPRRSATTTEGKSRIETACSHGQRHLAGYYERTCAIIGNRGVEGVLVEGWR